MNTPSETLKNFPPPLGADTTAIRRSALSLASQRFAFAEQSLDRSTVRLALARTELGEVSARIRAKVDHARLVNMDHLPVAIAVTSTSQYIRVNEAFAALIGITPAEIEGQLFTAFIRDGSMAPVAHPRHTGVRGFRTHIKRPDGRTFAVEWDCSDMTDGHFYCVVRALSDNPDSTG